MVPMLAFVKTHLHVEVANLIGEHAVFVRQETEASLLFQKRFSAAVSDELLHVHLARRDRLQKLRTGQDTRQQRGRGTK